MRRGIVRKFGIDTYTLLYFKRITILPNHPTLSLSHRVQKTVLYYTGFRIGNTCIPVADSC